MSLENIVDESRSKDITPLNNETNKKSFLKLRNSVEKLITSFKSSARNFSYLALSTMFVTSASLATKAEAGIVFDNVPIVIEPGNQTLPAIWGNYVVWSGSQNEAYDISQGKIVEMPGLVVPNLSQKPGIWNNIVVWDNSVGYYDLSLKQMVYPLGVSPVDPKIGLNPAIYGNKIIWAGLNGYYDFNLKSMVNLPDLSIGIRPAINENKIIWENPNGYYDINSEKMVFPPGLSIGTVPDIWENKIAWWNSGGYYDLSQEKMILSTDLDYMRDPAIYGDNIVYWKKQEAPSLFAWDAINHERAVSEYWGTDIDIWGNYVVWSDNRRGHYDIFLTKIPEPGALCLLGLGGLYALSKNRKQLKKEDIL